MRVLPDALDIGVSESSFWEMTLGEINRRIESYNRVQERRLKERAGMDYALAQLIAAGIGAVISGEDFPAISDAYPDLYDAPAPAGSENVQRFIQFAVQHNAAMKRGEEA